MTVIAWDGTTLAADRRCMIGGVVFETTKVLRVGGPSQLMPETLLGFAGSGARINQLVDWYCKGADPATYPARPADDDSMMVSVTQGPNGRCSIRRFDATGFPYELEDRFYADGAGRDVALAALHCGKTAAQAIELTAHLIATCGNGVDTLTFGDPP